MDIDRPRNILPHPALAANRANRGNSYVEHDGTVVQRDPVTGVWSRVGKVDLNERPQQMSREELLESMHDDLKRLETLNQCESGTTSPATSNIGTGFPPTRILDSYGLTEEFVRSVGENLDASDSMSITATRPGPSVGCSAVRATSESGCSATPLPSSATPSPTSRRRIGDVLEPGNLKPITVRDPQTGGEKQIKPLRYDLIPVGPLAEEAYVYGIGANRYAERNWEKGYKWSLSFRAAMSHLQRFWNGEDYDEDGFHHLAAVKFHCNALMEFSNTHPEKDDRPNKRTETSR